MARAWRIEGGGPVSRVVAGQRGNQRQAIFVEDEDGQLFLDRLGEMAQRFEAKIWAYVMTVHENFC